MLRKRLLIVVLAGVVALVSCENSEVGEVTRLTSEGPISPSDPADETTSPTTGNQEATSTTATGFQTTTTEVVLGTTTTYVTRNTNPRSTELIATPESGRPGDPLTICGFIGPGITITLGIGNLDTGDGWPQSDDHAVTADDKGYFCWEGLFPESMEVSHGPNANELYPTPAGRYQITANNRGFDFAYGRLDIVE